MNLHPASLLVAGVFLVLLLQQASFAALLYAALPLACFAFFFARQRSLHLLRRSRWVLMTMSLLFIWGSPGEYVPWLPLASWEGLLAAAEHGLRLVMLLLVLALLLELLSAEKLVLGLHALLLPLTYLGIKRDRIAVRLLLVMRYIDSPPVTHGWREWMAPFEPVPTRIDLRTHAFAAADFCLVGVCVLIFVWVLQQ